MDISKYIAGGIRYDELWTKDADDVESGKCCTRTMMVVKVGEGEGECKDRDNRNRYMM
jgi:hypothetical protein